MRAAEIYRDRDEGLRLRYEALEEKLAEREIDGAVVRVYRDRAARSAAGMTGVAGAVAVATTVGLEHAFGKPDGLATWVLVGSWGAVLAAHRAARAFAPARLRRGVDRMTRPTGDLERDLDRLERATPGHAQRALADGLERSSAALPLMGLALIAPLSLHLIAVTVVRAVGGQGLIEGDDFDTWIGLSLLIVGHAHITLAALGYTFARDLRASSAAVIGRTLTRKGWAALGWTVLASCVPGIVLILLPPILTAVTGLVFVPASFVLVRRKVLAERVALGVSPYEARLTPVGEG